jgi:hypothetical protein
MADNSTIYKDLICGALTVTQVNGNVLTTGTLGAGVGTLTSLNTPAIKTDTTTPTDLTITNGAVKTLVLATSVYDDLQFQVSYAKTNPANNF